jgi:hypothetical protein
VAISVNTAVIGAEKDDTPGGADAGSAYVFVRSGTTWSQQAKLTASDGADDDRFGGSVAVAEDTAVVGSGRDDNEAGTDAGSAYAFVRSGTTWTEQDKLTAPDGDSEDRFGDAVALDGNVAVVGAFADDIQEGTDAGSASVFTRSGSTWIPRAKITAPDADGNDNFGDSVAVDGTTAVVGAPDDDILAGMDAGSAWAFWR